MVDGDDEDIKKASFAHRISRLEPKDYDKILNTGKSSGSKGKKKESIEVDHEANIKQASGG